MKKIIILIAAIIYLTVPVKLQYVSAKYIAYPIKSLGNCQNTQDCYYYCQIPAHSPACWAYGEYVLKPDVLGEQTAANITFPVPELGNCANRQDCFAFCNKPENQDACFAFARKNKLLKETDTNLPPPSEIIAQAKTELGCDSRESCKELCENPQNIEVCRSFAERHKLNIPAQNSNYQGPAPDEIMKKAKTQLGCVSETRCRSFCADPANSSKCLEFARNNKLLDSNQEREVEKLEVKKGQMIEAAKKELGCNSMESCSAFCSQSQNSQKCAELAQKLHYRNDDESQRKDTKPQNTTPCVSDEDCQKYCQSHPNECPGLIDDDINEHKNTSPKLSNKSTDQTGDFIGPTGCKTEGECQAYCLKHPKECPGLPKEQTLPETRPTPRISRDKKVTPIPNVSNDPSKPYISTAPLQ